MPWTFKPRQMLVVSARIQEVDELKGLALLLVLIYHCCGEMAWPNFLAGDVGVDIFIILSGFTLALSSEAIPIGAFLRRRLFRIAPSYWVALTFFLFWHRLCAESHSNITSIVLHYLGLHAFGQPKYFFDINDSFWFISLIVTLYCLFLFTRRWLRRPDILLGFGFGLAAIATIASWWWYNLGFLTHFAPRIPDFFFGMGAGSLFQQQKTELRSSPALWVGLSSIVIVYVAIGYASFLPWLGLGIIAGFLALRKRLIEGRPFRFSVRLLAIVGIYSYEIYLLHQPIIRSLAHAFPPDGPSGLARNRPILGIAVGIAITIPLSVLLHRGTAYCFSHYKGQARGASA